MNILIVEDDYITSQVMKEILMSFGNCEIAENGRNALELFYNALDEKTPYDLIFLDIMMPEIDGQETLQKIREIEYTHGIMGLDGVKIIMTTALDDYENITKAFKSQCEGYVVKPIDKDKIVNVLLNLNLLE
jgi:two-component system, chemotaxis family, chemotaxis protein CheY